MISITQHFFLEICSYNFGESADIIPAPVLQTVSHSLGATEKAVDI
jgi:hypothetical protein